MDCTVPVNGLAVPALELDLLDFFMKMDQTDFSGKFSGIFKHPPQAASSKAFKAPVNGFPYC